MLIIAILCKCATSHLIQLLILHGFTLTIPVTHPGGPAWRPVAASNHQHFGSASRSTDERNATSCGATVQGKWGENYGYTSAAT